MKSIIFNTDEVRSIPEYKQVIRYQCPYCKRLYAQKETMDRHIKECCKNPNGVNCFVCKHLPLNQDTFSCIDNAGKEYICDYHEESVFAIKHSDPRIYKSWAPFCSEFERTEKP